MGVEQSLPLNLANTFDQDEIKRLAKRFKRLDLNKDGSLSLDEFMSIPELQQNPLVKRVIDILDTDRNGSIDFQGYCCCCCCCRCCCFIRDCCM
jgi:Ca2+-binding EF-hand superfamily protein